MSDCEVRDCGSPDARTGGVCDSCWDDRERVLAALPQLWITGHNVLPPGSHGLQEDTGGPHTPGPRSPVNDFALETLHGVATELTGWANTALRLRELEPISKLNMRWGVLLGRAIGALNICDEEFHYGPLAAEYVNSVRWQRFRLNLLAGLDTLIHKLPAPCARCNRVGLIRHNGKEIVVCTNCGGNWPEIEYRKHVLVLAKRYQFASIRSPKGDAR